MGHTLTLGYLWAPVPELDSDLGASAIYDKEQRFSLEAVKAINNIQPRPAFEIVCGDLVNAYPNKEEGGTSTLHDAQVKDYKRIMQHIHKVRDVVSSLL